MHEVQLYKMNEIFIHIYHSESKRLPLFAVLLNFEDALILQLFRLFLFGFLLEMLVGIVFHSFLLYLLLRPILLQECPFVCCWWVIPKVKCASFFILNDFVVTFLVILGVDSGVKSLRSDVPTFEQTSLAFFSKNFVPRVLDMVSTG